jgi:hypothetical protein
MLPERKANQRLMKSLVFNTASFAKAFDPISARKKLNRLPSKLPSRALHFTIDSILRPS